MFVVTLPFPSFPLPLPLLPSSLILPLLSPLLLATPTPSYLLHSPAQATSCSAQGSTVSPPLLFIKTLVLPHSLEPTHPSIHSSSLFFQALTLLPSLLLPSLLSSLSCPSPLRPFFFFLFFYPFPFPFNYPFTSPSSYSSYSYSYSPFFSISLERTPLSGNYFCLVLLSSISLILHVSLSHLLSFSYSSATWHVPVHSTNTSTSTSTSPTIRPTVPLSHSLTLSLSLPLPAPWLDPSSSYFYLLHSLTSSFSLSLFSSPFIHSFIFSSHSSFSPSSFPFPLPFLSFSSSSSITLSPLILFTLLLSSSLLISDCFPTTLTAFDRLIRPLT